METFIYITPDGSEYEDQTGNDTEKVLFISYEASADGINWIQAINDNGKTVIKARCPTNIPSAPAFEASSVPIHSK